MKKKEQVVYLMDIAVCGPVGNDSFADNVAATAARLGHSVHQLGAARPPLLSRQFDSLLSLVSDQKRVIDGCRQKRIAREVKERRSDLLISVDRRLHPDVIAAAQSVGTKVVLWFPDAVHNLARHDVFVAGYDRIYFKNPVLSTWLHDIQGLSVGFLPEAANSESHFTDKEYGTDKSIVVAGNIHPTRAVLLRRLMADGVPMKIFGPEVPPWIGMPELTAAHTGKFVFGKEKADTFRSARAVLNNLHPAEFAGTNCRLYEAAAAGAVVLTEDRPGLATQFDTTSEVSTFDNYSTLLQTIRSLLEDPGKGRSIGDAAARRAKRDHTYEHRLATMFADVL